MICGADNQHRSQLVLYKSMFIIVLEEAGGAEPQILLSGFILSVYLTRVLKRLLTKILNTSTF